MRLERWCFRQILMQSRKQQCEEDLMKAVFKRCGRANEGCLDPRTSDSGCHFYS